MAARSSRSRPWLGSNTWHSVISTFTSTYASHLKSEEGMEVEEEVEMEIEVDLDVEVEVDRTHGHLL